MGIPAGWKNFTQNILSSDEVNNYLMSQTVMVFANSSARTSGLGTPAQGMITFLKDTNSLEYYTGTSWTGLLSATRTATMNNGEIFVNTGKIAMNRANATGGSTAGGIDFRIDGSTYGQIFMSNSNQMRFTAASNSFDGSITSSGGLSGTSLNIGNNGATIYGATNILSNAGSGFFSRIYVSNNGNVGIQTTSPSTALNVVGTMYSSVVQTQNQIEAGSYGYFAWYAYTPGGLSIGSGSAISNFINYRAIQVSTATAWGGIYDNHSGYLINSYMPAGWTSAALQFRTSSDWGTYNSYTVTLQYGNIYGNGWSMSDRRTKTNIEDSQYGIETVRQMVPKRFGYKMPDGTDNTHVSLTNKKVGFIAQELAEILPDAVFNQEDQDQENEHGYAYSYSIDYGSLTAVLTKAIQELDARVSALEEQ